MGRDGSDATDGHMGRALVIPSTHPSYLSHPSHLRLIRPQCAAAPGTGLA